VVPKSAIFFSVDPRNRRQITLAVDTRAIDEVKRISEERELEYNPPLLPNPKLIALRAAVARVANLSGAAEQEDRVMKDREDINVVSDDYSADVLHSLLSRLVPAYA
jgi:hypothetical protein